MQEPLQAMQCRYCGGFNVSIDFETGKLTCNDCPPNKQIPHRGKLVDLEEMKMKSIEQEEEAMQKAKQAGIETKVNPIKDFNKK
jgi:hypothetical protein